MLGHSLGGLFASRLRRILMATVVIIALLCTGAYAYWVSLPLPRTAGPRVSITSTPLQLSIGLDKTEYAATDNLTVYFSLRNISNKTVTLTEHVRYGLGLEPLDPVFRATTSAEGASTSEPNMINTLFHFHFRWVDSNGTVIYDTTSLFLYSALYDIVLAPDGYLNQTLHISIPGLFGIDGQSPRIEAYQISGMLYGVTISGSNELTIETPSIGFTIQ
jgi:hypothetical protein